MDLMTALDAVPGIGPALPYVAVVMAVFTAMAATLPPPKGAGWYAQMYRAVNFIAMNFGHARNASAPVKAPAADPHAVIASPDHSKL